MTRRHDPPDAEIVPFPGCELAAAVDDEPELNLEEICERQRVLLDRWLILAAEIKRTLGPLPVAVAIEFYDLMIESAA